MNKQTMTGFSSEAISPACMLADQAFSRAAGAPLVAGNTVRLLKDAGENYPAWFEAINSKRSSGETRIIEMNMSSGNR